MIPSGLAGDLTSLNRTIELNIDTSKLRLSGSCITCMHIVRSVYRTGFAKYKYIQCLPNNFYLVNNSTHLKYTYIISSHINSFFNFYSVKLTFSITCQLLSLKDFALLIIIASHAELLLAYTSLLTLAVTKAHS